MHLRSIYRDGWLCTAYEPSTKGRPTGIDAFFERFMPGMGAFESTIEYAGTEGELYDTRDDPYQWHNRWDDPACRALRDDLVADLYDHLPPPREPRLEVSRPA
jgi:hypothetical protein